MIVLCCVYLLQNFEAEIKDFSDDPSNPTVIASFKSRSMAEKAVSKGSNFKDKKLVLAWYAPSLLKLSASSAASFQVDDDTDLGDLDEAEAALLAEVLILSNLFFIMKFPDFFYILFNIAFIFAFPAYLSHHFPMCKIGLLL